EVVGRKPPKTRVEYTSRTDDVNEKALPAGEYRENFSHEERIARIVRQGCCLHRPKGGLWSHGTTGRDRWKRALSFGRRAGAGPEGGAHALGASFRCPHDHGDRGTGGSVPAAARHGAPLPAIRGSLACQHLGPEV